MVLGVCGSIAAYKSAVLARLLVSPTNGDEPFDVWPILTRSACRFIGPLTLSILTGHRAETDLWSAAEGGRVPHVEVASRADAIVIAPATAHTIAQLAAGTANDPLVATVLSSRAPLVIAPAMETQMWQDAQQRLHTIAARRRDAGAGAVTVVAPESGELASGRVGDGRMAEPEAIVEAVHRSIAAADDALAGKTVLIGAGPTRQAFDPARFLSNPSSGKMGFALARMAHRRGAHVTVVSGPTSLAPPIGCRLHRCTTTEEMLQALNSALCAPYPGSQGNSRAAADVLIMAAAPCDYKPRAARAEKIKKEAGGLETEFIRTPDILSCLSRPEDGKTMFVGFAAETDEGRLIDLARDKLQRKRLDLIVANVIGSGRGFADDQNEVVLVDAKGCERLPLLHKNQVASHILDRTAVWLNTRVARDREVR